MIPRYNNKSPKKIKNFSLKSIEVYINKKLNNKYFKNELCYGAKVINDIVYNEQTLKVAKFKDFLILDDDSEFLKRYYTLSESSIRLSKFCEYYTCYSLVFPNYISLPQSKYIFKNIHKKQKMINGQKEMEKSLEKINKNKSRSRPKQNEFKVFSTEVCNAIQNDSSCYVKLFGNEKENEIIEAENDKNINKIIGQIEKYNNNSNNNNNNQGLSIAKPKDINSLNILYRKNMKNNSKDIINRSNRNFNNKNSNLLSEGNIANNINNVMSLHRKTLSSSYSKWKTKNKIKKYIGNIFIPLTQRYVRNKDVIGSKVMVNININKNKDHSSSNSKNKNKGIKINNMNIDIKKPNLILNKGKLFNYKAITERNNFTINNKVKSLLINNNSKYFIDNLFLKTSKSIKGGKINDKVDKPQHTERSKSIFDIAFIHKFLMKKNKKGGEIQTLIGKITSSPTSRNSSHSKGKSKKHVNYGSNFSRNEKKIITIKPITELRENKRHFDSKSKDEIIHPSSPKQKKMIKGIKIKNFNKALGLKEIILSQHDNEESLKSKVYRQPNTTRDKKNKIYKYL